ncbi:MAG: helix-turn-helix transcriptional regulator [Opitutaceae bacterium]|nr:helix-turn-helix transcriptional regulator [Opitutaceae bacterium]
MKAVTLADYHDRMNAVCAQLLSHRHDPPDIETLARRAGLSVSRFERVYVRMFGESIRACLKRIRLEHAATELRTTRRRILTLAREAGYDNHEAFTRAFKRRFGMSPALYRGLPQVSRQPRRRTSLWQQALATSAQRPVAKRR